MFFSQRNKLKPSRLELQRNGIDDVLRNKLWTVIHVVCFEDNSERYGRQFGIVGAIGSMVNLTALSRSLWTGFFGRPVDEAPRAGTLSLPLRKWFFEAKWNEVFDLFEFLYSFLSEDFVKSDLSKLTNHMLTAEMSAYRLVEGRFVDTISDVEQEAVNDALNGKKVLQQSRTHLREALTKLTDRKTPDYRNSIKESISAVEAACREITGDKTATLGQALKRLRESDSPIHPSLEQAWLKMYGYTSDQGGIRHALSDESTVTYADAKYMLVTCSAFINYLLEQKASSTRNK